MIFLLVLDAIKQMAENDPYIALEETVFIDEEETVGYDDDKKEEEESADGE